MPTYLNEICESSTKYDGITTTATALAPACPEQSENPSWEEEEPDLIHKGQDGYSIQIFTDHTGGHQVMIPELAGVTRGVTR